MSASPNPPDAAPKTPNVGLLVTCIVDLWRPTVGFAAVKLLEDAGCRVAVPEQTCCGQPAYNAGDRADAADLARRMIATFENFDYVVVPSGSCGGMVRVHYPDLLKDDPEWGPRATALAAKTWELTAFLTDVMGVRAVAARLDATATYHDSCAGLRELGVKAQPRRLLASVEGLNLVEMDDPERCCGFGGMFCVKYPEISNAMVSDKSKDAAATGAELVLAGEVSCLMNIAGKLQREGRAVKARHVAEVLAGMTDEVPPIGEPR